MTSRIKNIIIFVSIAVVLILLYVFFIKGEPEEPSLVSSGGGMEGGVVGGQNLPIAQDFLSLLLNVKGISLESSIFSDPAFKSLQDSSITLIPDGTEGRPNPFAPIGSDIIVPPVVPSLPAPSLPGASTSPTSSIEEGMPISQIGVEETSPL